MQMQGKHGDQSQCMTTKPILKPTLKAAKGAVGAGPGRQAAVAAGVVVGGRPTAGCCLVGRGGVGSCGCGTLVRPCPVSCVARASQRLRGAARSQVGGAGKDDNMGHVTGLCYPTCCLCGRVRQCRRTTELLSTAAVCMRCRYICLAHSV